MFVTFKIKTVYVKTVGNPMALGFYRFMFNVSLGLSNLFISSSETHDQSIPLHSIHRLM